MEKGEKWVKLGNGCVSSFVAVSKEVETEGRVAGAILNGGFYLLHPLKKTK